MHTGDIPVKDHDIVGGDREALKGVLAVEDDVNGHAGPAQTGRQRYGQLGVVFDYQHPHRSRMHDRLLQNHYCVAAPQHALAYNAGMSLSRPVRGRSRAFLLTAALVAAGLLAACGGGSFLSVRNSTLLSLTNTTASELGQAGFRDALIHLESGSGLPQDGLVDVSYSTGPGRNAATDVDIAERIVWNSLPYRFGLLAVSQTSGGCARGSFCASSSTEVGSETYAQLRAEFGSRRAGLDKTSVSQTDPIPSWLPGVVCVLAVAIVAAVVLARHRAQRPRRDRAPSPRSP